MTARRIFLVWGFLSLAMIYGVHVPGQAMAFSPEAQNLFEQSRFEMDDGNYKDALELIDKALEIDATIPEYLFTRGQILIRLERYDEAEAQLLPIKDNAVFIELGALYAKRGRYRQSIEAYTKALAAFPTRADLYLARGKVFIELKEDSRAEADILKAAEVRPTLKIASLFHLALLKYKREDFEGAKAKLDEALALGPNPEIVQQIKNYRSTIEKEERSLKWWAVNTSFFIQYDDNLSLEPLDGFGVGQAGAATTDKDDWGIGWNLSGTYYLLNRRFTKSGFAYTYRDLKYSDHTDSNLQSHTVSGFYSNYLEPWFFRVQADLGMYYTGAEGDHRLTMYSIIPSVVRIFSPKDRTQLFGAFESKVRHDETDDSFRTVLNATHFHTFKFLKDLTVRGGFQYESESYDGDNGASYRVYELQAGVSFPIKFDIMGDFGVGYGWINYDLDENLDPLIEREDDRLTLQAKLSRKINDYLSAELQWYHTYNDSNLENNAGIDIYEYKRNVFTMTLSGSF